MRIKTKAGTFSNRLDAARVVLAIRGYGEGNGKCSGRASYYGHVLLFALKDLLAVGMRKDDTKNLGRFQSKPYRPISRPVDKMEHISAHAPIIFRPCVASLKHYSA